MTVRRDPGWFLWNFEAEVVGWVFEGIECGLLWIVFGEGFE